MFCKNCGSEMNDTASFCKNCGTPVGQISTVATKNDDSKKEDNIVRLEIIPKFVLGYQFLLMMKKMLLILFFIGFSCQSILYSMNTESIMNVIAWVVGIVVFICIIKLFLKKAQHKRSNYKFLKTKVEYTDSFLYQQEKQLKYEYVREVNMSQSILERIFRIATIKLSSSATGASGMCIHCVENAHETLQEIKKIIDEATE